MSSSESSRSATTIVVRCSLDWKRDKLAYLFDGNNLLRVIVHGLVDGSKTAGSKFLEEGILACWIGTGNWGGLSLSLGTSLVFRLWRRGWGAREYFWLRVGIDIVRTGTLFETRIGEHGELGIKSVAEETDENQKEITRIVSDLMLR